MFDLNELLSVIRNEIVPKFGGVWEIENTGRTDSYPKEHLILRERYKNMLDQTLEFNKVEIIIWNECYVVKVNTGLFFAEHFVANEFSEQGVVERLLKFYSMGIIK